jgi:threonine-phosphate decarboxylase
VLRSLTKAFAIPGLRLGYLVASTSLVRALRDAQQPWPLNAFAVAVGTPLFSETAYLARSRRAVAEFRSELQRLLGEIAGIHPFPSTTNFVLCKLTVPEMTSSELCERLAQQGILIRNCDSFAGLEPGRFVRIAVRTQEDNERLVKALRQLLGGSF